MAVSRGSTSLSIDNALHNICIPTIESETSIAQEIVDSALISAISIVTGESIDTVTQSLRNMELDRTADGTVSVPTVTITAPEHLKSAMNTRGRKISTDGRKRSVTFDPKFIKDNNGNNTETNANITESNNNNKEYDREHSATAHHAHIQQPPTVSSWKEDEESDPESETTRL